jgi:hypothetical protein
MHFFWTFGKYVHTYIPKPYISNSLINAITRPYMHTWHSEPLGNSCYTCTPNICPLIKSNQRHISVAHACMTFWTFGELMLYMHSKYTTLHRMQMHSSRISLYICFSSHTKKHIHTNTSSMKSFSKTCHTSSCYVCSFSFFLVSLPARL